MAGRTAGRIAGRMARVPEIVTRRSEVAIHALRATVEKPVGLLGESADTATVVAAVQDSAQDSAQDSEQEG